MPNIWREWYTNTYNFCHWQLKLHADLSHYVCANITHWRTDFSVYFAPWGKLRNNNCLGNIFIKTKENKGVYWKNNANILKTKKLIANVIVATVAPLQNCDRRGSCITIWSKVFFTWSVLFDLVLFSILFLYSWESLQWEN